MTETSHLGSTNHPSTDDWLTRCGMEALCGVAQPPSAALPLPPFDPALAAELKPLRKAEPRIVFCPSKRSAFAVNVFYAELLRQGPTLFLASQASHLSLGARPGLLTLFAPHFPSVHGTALASAAGVVAQRIRPLLAAVANGVPSVWAGHHRHSRAIAEQLQIPCLKEELSPAEAAQAAWEILFNYPWERVQDRLHQAKRELVKWASTFGGRRRQNLKLARSRGEMLHVASISDSSYLPYLLGLIENALQVEPDRIHFHILALDAHVMPALEQQYSKGLFTGYTLQDVWSPIEVRQIEQRPIGIRAFSSKPRFLLHALQRAKRPVLYSDSDVFFFRSPAHLLMEEIQGKTCLLFPHWNDKVNAARADGIYNAGFIAVAPGAERLLEWWSQLCLYRCALNEGDGAVGDQGYLDFAPAYWDGVKVYRAGDHNVARWNLRTLKVRFSENQPGVVELGEGRPIASYHAAFVDSLGVFEAKYAWDQMVAFFSGTIPLPKGPMHFFHNTLIQQRAYWLALSRALAFYQKLPFWLKRHWPLGEARILRWMRGYRLRLLELLAAIHRALPAKVVSPAIEDKATPSGEDEGWIALQRQVFCREEATAPSARGRKRA